MAEQGYDFAPIEEKWRKQWQDADLFKSTPDDRDKFYINFAYAYPSGGMHVGHVRTYTISDVIARFKRMQGFNVLFPTGWHVTGTPILGAVDRLKNREEEQLFVLQDVYGVADDELEDLETPEGFAQYFVNQYREAMQRLGFMIDWRRETWTNDPHYNQFIQWQYRTLKQGGYVKQGLHPVKYCVNHESPVTAHDLLDGENAERNEYTLILFTLELDGETVQVPMATLRPETVFGVTNVFVDPDGSYVTATVDGETWLLSQTAADKLQHQDFTISIQDTYTGNQLIGRFMENPVTDDTVPVLPAAFVDTNNATGLVMSVPAHAPVDYLAVEEAKTVDYTQYGHAADDFAEQVENIEPVSVITVPGYGSIPAKEAVAEHEATSQTDDAVAAATDDVYTKEHHDGVMTVEPFENVPVQAMEDKLWDRYGDAFFASMYDFSEDVVCRCGGSVVVAEADSWFLTYNDPHWQEQAVNCLDQADIIPEKLRKEMVHAIEWLEEWPCIRNYGLGTDLPFDDRFIIEPLSDSTIYMAYFTISHRLQEYDPDQLTDAFFDYVFRGNGAPETVADDTGIPTEELEQLRDEFQYWYPLDYNCSGNDLVQNHLVFYLYHHAALFNEPHWPQGTAVWGMGLLEGEKMSSSKGHVEPALDALDQYGADTVRFYLFANWEPWQDFDWRSNEVEQHQNHLTNWFNQVNALYNSGEERDITQIDKYLLSRVQERVQEATTALDNFQTRKAALHIFFKLNKELDWYTRRTDTVNRDVMNTVLETQVKLMAPFTPYLAEELWENMGRDGFVSTAEWPEYTPEDRHLAAEHGEKLVKDTLQDAQEVAELVDTDFDTVRVIVAPHWKYAAYAHIKELDTRDMGKIMESLKEDHAPHMQQLKDVVQEYVENPASIGTVATQDIEKEALQDAADFLAAEIGAANVIVETADESESSRADRAEPGTPAISLE